MNETRTQARARRVAEWQRQDALGVQALAADITKVFTGAPSETTDAVQRVLTSVLADPPAVAKHTLRQIAKALSGL